MKKLVNELYQRYPQGFYVNAEQRMKDARVSAKYIGLFGTSCDSRIPSSEL